LTAESARLAAAPSRGRAKTAEKSKFKNKKYNSANSAASAVKNRRVTFASVAELADAQGLGPCVLLDVEVRLLSLAVL
jgi:hypothetical protein